MPRQAQNIGRARSKNFSHTTNGLLTKRADLLGELIVLDATRDSKRLDIEAIDRVLVNVLAYEGDLDAVKPTGQRISYFKHGQLGREVMETLRDTDKSLTPREIALAIIEKRGMDLDMHETHRFTASVSRACQRAEGRFVRRYVDGLGAVRWGK